MAATSSNPLPSNSNLCESRYEPSEAGCCSDGRKCDDLCIELAAAYMCQQQAAHASTSALDTGCCGGCCPNQIQEADLENDKASCCGSCENEVAASASPSCGDCCDKDSIVQTTCVQPETRGACSNAGPDPTCCGPFTETEEPSLRVKPVAVSQVCGSFCCDDSKALASPRSSFSAKAQPTGQTSNAASDGLHSSEAELDKDTCKGCCSDCESTTSTNTSGQADKKQAEHKTIEVDCSSEVASEFDACSEHLAAAMRRFSSFLEAGLCICRSVINSSEVCCDEEKRSAALEARVRRKERRVKESRGLSSAISRKLSTDACRQRGSQRPCCSSGSRADASPIQERCTKDDAQVVDTAKTGPLGVGIQTEVTKVDPENPPTHEHVIFSISGMTCTGCVKKVLGVLDHVPGVRDVNVNYVAGRGECTIDPTIISPDQALKKLERETGFEYTRIINTLVTLDLVIAPDDVGRLRDTPPSGIESFDRLKKNIYRVGFDPRVIGARKVLLVSNGHLAPLDLDSALADGQRKLISKLWSFVASASMTVPVVVLAWGNTKVPIVTKSIVSLVLATGVQAIAIPEFYLPAIKALVFSKSIEMDMLVVISITAAYVYSVVAFGITQAGYHLEQAEFFETSTLLITLVLLGRLVSTYAKVRAVSAVSVKSLQAESALLEQDSQGDRTELTEVDARLLEYDDVIRIPPHSRIVTDSVVILGSSAVDESMLTGESTPVHKQPGDVVTAGTINGNWQLTARIVRLPGQNSISDIANLVSDALGTKPKLQDLADLISGWFVPVVVGISLAVLIVWLVVAAKVRHENAGGAIGTAITYSIAVLAISCPCAVGLAVPLVLVIAGGIAAKSGLVVKSAHVFEQGHRVTDVVFDKTGTLTLNEVKVVHEEVVHDRSAVTEIRALVYALTRNSEHPVSQAVNLHLRAQNPDAIDLADFQSVPGAGVTARWKGSIVQAGNPNWLAISTHASVISLQRRGLSLLCVTIDNELHAIFGLQGTTRREAASTIDALRARGVQSHIVSGDHEHAVKALGQSLGIPDENLIAGRSPEGKREYVQRLQSHHHNHKRVVLYVGDGTNDAGAIAQADVGLQIGDASDLSRAACDVVLLGGLDGIVTLLNISQSAYRRIIFNFVWSGVYNVAAILLASGAIVKFRVPPAYAGLGEIVSVLPVVAVALSLMWVSTWKARQISTL